MWLVSDLKKGEEPNDRKIGKLCEYAGKNPLRVPKVSLMFSDVIFD